jgi:hypothetical protein
MTWQRRFEGRLSYRGMNLRVVVAFVTASQSGVRRIEFLYCANIKYFVVCLSVMSVETGQLRMHHGPADPPFSLTNLLSLLGLHDFSIYQHEYGCSHGSSEQHYPGGGGFKKVLEVSGNSLRHESHGRSTQQIGSVLQQVRRDNTMVLLSRLSNDHSMKSPFITCMCSRTG